MSQPGFAVAIGGGASAGKSHMANKIKESNECSVTILPLDDYFEDRSGLTEEEINNVNFDHPSAYDWKLFEEHLANLFDGKKINKPVYDHMSASRSNERVETKPGEILVIEGLYVLYNKTVRDNADISIYLEEDPDTRLIRRLRSFVVEGNKSLQEALDQYSDYVKPMHEDHIRETKKHAELVIKSQNINSVVEIL